MRSDAQTLSHRQATNPDLSQLRDSGPDEHTLPTVVGEGATIGAGCIIGCDLEIGRFAMVGMGSLVTRSIPQFALVIGHPARIVGFVDRDGQPWVRLKPDAPCPQVDFTCPNGYRYSLKDWVVREQLPE